MRKAAGMQSNLTHRSVPASITHLQSSRRGFLQKLSGCTREIELALLRELTEWFTHIEKELAGQCSLHLSEWIKYLGYTDPSNYATHYQLLIAAIVTLQRMEDKCQIDIDTIARSICEAHSKPLDPTIINTARQSVLCILGCLTMRFGWAVPPSDDVLAISTPHSRNIILRPQPAIPGAQRSIGKLLASFGLPLMKPDICDEPIHSSMLSYSTLSTIGKIKIYLVDHIGSHLVFNPLTRRLSIFAYPAFCELLCNRSYKVTVMEKITLDYSDGDSAEIIRKTLQEILLSYRLLFAYNNKSRLLFFSTCVPEASSLAQVSPFIKSLVSPPKSKALSRISQDCWPDSVLSPEGQLIDQDVYSSSIDFVILGRRLLELQSHCSRQNPSKIWDMWQDRRNRREWITFWAVIIIGGASIILSFLQVLLTLVQVVEGRTGL